MHPSGVDSQLPTAVLNPEKVRGKGRPKGTTRVGVATGQRPTPRRTPLQAVENVGGASAQASVEIGGSLGCAATWVQHVARMSRQWTGSGQRMGSR